MDRRIAGAHFKAKTCRRTTILTVMSFAVMIL
jgi:hypothetical protein